MLKGLVVVTGATGNIGSALCELLMAQGRKVRAIGRTERRLKPLLHKGAETHVGFLGDVKSIEQGFENADAAFLMIPPDYRAEDYYGFQQEVADSLVETVRGSTVRHVVTLSSVGAHLESGTGPIRGLHYLEKKVDALQGVEAVHLRPCYFMENHLHGLKLMKEKGVYGTALKGDLSIPQIATKDIAAAAAQLLGRRDFTGKTAKELLGHGQHTMEESAKILSRAVGTVTPYAQFPYDEVKKAMLGAGMAKGAVDTFIEMYQAFNDGKIVPQEKRSKANTTPTSLEDFAKTTFKAAFDALQGPAPAEAPSVAAGANGGEAQG